MFSHTPVLLKEVIDALDVKPGGKYIDATLGGAGHTRGIIDRGGIVLGIDQDQEALEFVENNFQLLKSVSSQASLTSNSQLKVVYGNFREIKRIALENNFEGVDGILFDLGVSSYQLDSKERGFSIKQNGPLDMRMDKNLDITAADIVNSYSVEALIDIFQRYGEEEEAAEAAAQIIKARKARRIETTGELIEILNQALKRHGKMHPATKIFQALRIEVNKETEALKTGLDGALELLNTEGKILVISFHSLEDRIVKTHFDNWQKKGLGKVKNRKPIVAESGEVRSNPRARSAKMRVFEKLGK